MYFTGYKAFLVYPNLDYKVSLNQKKLIKLDTSLASDIDKAIIKQYLSAYEKYLDIEEMKDPYPYAPMDSTKLTIAQIKADRRRKILNVSEKKLKKQVTKYDRYYFGYENTKGEEWVFIMFDPHKIKYFNAGGERHIRNLSPMVYSIAAKKLYLASWSGQGE
ncbi:hypothetical protein QUB32_30935 [Microcoleus sp. AT8-A4]|uniref:hypothetical protein n=1 Tax=Microcoleus sp. AT8-A4 TaxID=2818615 RepID=UPI002FD33589